MFCFLILPLFLISFRVLFFEVFPYPLKNSLYRYCGGVQVIVNMRNQCNVISVRQSNEKHKGHNRSIIMLLLLLFAPTTIASPHAKSCLPPTRCYQLVLHKDSCLVFIRSFTTMFFEHRLSLKKFDFLFAKWRRFVFAGLATAQITGGRGGSSLVVTHGEESDVLFNLLIFHTMICKLPVRHCVCSDVFLTTFGMNFTSEVVCFENDIHNNLNFFVSSSECAFMLFFVIYL